MLSTTSPAPTATAVPNDEFLDIPLESLCSKIDNPGSLQTAEIISTECYRERAGLVTHKFLVLELRRPGRKVGWLRLDRRRGVGVSLSRFVGLSGVTKPNDRVCC